MSSTDANAWGAAAVTAGFIVAVVAYWVPSIVAARRHVPARSQVVVVNLLLGWTVIGWVVALVMALRQLPPAATR